MQYFSIPVDHLHNDSNYEPHSFATYKNRWYFDDTYYKPGGPVIALNGAEGDATASLAFLQNGIIKILAEETGGMGVVFEHRYYGKSFPVEDLSTKNLRFLSSDQAMADMAYFSKHVTFPGHESQNITATATPWIWYGGSYAGGLVSIYRKAYPDVAFGSVASSSVTAPVSDYWQYYEAIRKYAPVNCTDVQAQIVGVIDNILLSNDDRDQGLLKKVFGLARVPDNRNFATVVTGGRGQWASFVESTAGGIGNWQNREWKKTLYDGSFELYCKNITSTAIEYPETASLKSDVQYLIRRAGLGSQSASLLHSFLNLIGYVNLTAVSTCKDSQEMCFSQWTNASASFYTDKSLSNTAITWPYQFCTQWGLLPAGDIPEKYHGLKPLVSRLITDDYNRLICKYAFGIRAPPDVGAIAAWGGRDLTYPRLAQVHGQADNWRPASPMWDFPGGRPSTTSEPRVLVEGGVHGWDMFGVFANQTAPGYPPQAVINAHATIARFVKAWVADWKGSD